MQQGKKNNSLLKESPNLTVFKKAQILSPKVNKHSPNKNRF
jgi:hypothetical protein